MVGPLQTQCPRYNVRRCNYAFFPKDLPRITAPRCFSLVSRSPEVSIESSRDSSAPWPIIYHLGSVTRARMKYRFTKQQKDCCKLASRTQTRDTLFLTIAANNIPRDETRRGPPPTISFLFFHVVSVYFPSLWANVQGPQPGWIVAKVVQRRDKERNPMRVPDKWLMPLVRGTRMFLVYGLKRSRGVVVTPSVSPFTRPKPKGVAWIELCYRGMRSRSRTKWLD